MQEQHQKREPTPVAAEAAIVSPAPKRIIKPLSVNYLLSAPAKQTGKMMETRQELFKKRGEELEEKFKKMFQ